MGWVHLGPGACERVPSVGLSPQRAADPIRWVRVPRWAGVPWWGIVLLGADCPCGVESPAGAESLGETFSGEAEYPGGVAPPVGTKAPCGAEIPGVWVSPCGAKPPVCRSPIMVLILCWVGGLWCGDAPGWAESLGGLAPCGLSTSLRLRHFLPCRLRVPAVGPSPPVEWRPW